MPELQEDSLGSVFILAAMPGMTDPNFERSVVLIASHGKKGSIGFVVNRKINISIASIIDNPFIKIPPQLKVWLGGPCDQSHGIILRKKIDLGSQSDAHMHRSNISYLGKGKERRPDASPAHKNTYEDSSSNMRAKADGQPALDKRESKATPTGIVSDSIGFELVSTPSAINELVQHFHAVEEGSSNSVKLAQGKGITPMANHQQRFIIGSAGWEPEQLREEIRYGNWLVLEFDPELIFETHYDDMWTTALSKKGIASQNVIPLTQHIRN